MNNPDIRNASSTLYNRIRIDDEPEMIHSPGAETRSAIEWETYYELCVKPLDSPGNRIKTQLVCDQLSGITVFWMGTVASVEINRIDNRLEHFIATYLPNSLSEWIRCWCGDRYEDNLADFNLEGSGAIHGHRGKCHLQAWNEYEYSVNLRMGTGLLKKPVEITLRATHAFSNFTLNLVESDRIWVRGKLLKDPKVDPHRASADGGNRVLIDTIAITCDTCKMDLIEVTAVPQRLRLSDHFQELCNGFKYFLNVIFNPVIIFK